ncbi:ABC transporter substrate-binding protein [Cohnella xylanilytica]|uniref:ABC transporter substrate-binding protein n=1 Tax=Cohnella xylanilytica TaxID=557555 RepID=A0A841TXK5_9BACL|nr:ABC transporter substrate-binding protein [Cohnella xylanilytica]MBB6691752.1 ABC transporter substrate-binding protein [Cohnella xylanilytica]GIO13239.1 ABC transporter substrate-binding protein [Cohnella xylanilytica]
MKVAKGWGMALASVIAAALVISGCSGNGSSSSGSPGEEPKAGGTATADAGGAKPDISKYRKLKVYTVGNFPQKDSEAVIGEINKYLKEKINAEIDFQGLPWSSWAEKMVLAYQSGEQVDLTFAPNWADFANNVAKGAFLPLDDLLAEYGKGITDSLDPRFFDGGRVDGKIYAIPTNKEIGESHTIMFRKDLIDKYGFDVDSIHTLEDLEPWLQTIKEKEPGLAPIWLSGSGSDTLSYFDKTIPSMKENFRYELVAGAPAGIVLDTKTDKMIISSMESEAAIYRMRLYSDWFKKGYINQDAATTKTSAEDALKAGKTWMKFGSDKPDSDKEDSAATGIELVKLKGNDPEISTASVSNSMMAIGRTSVDPERTMMLLNLLHTDKHLVNLIDFGVEGRQYVKVEGKENFIKLPDGIATRADTGWAPGIEWMFGNQTLTYLWEGESPDKWEKFKEYNEKAHKVKSFGFNFNTDPVKTEVSVVSNIIKEYRPLLETGSLDADKVLAEYNGKLKANGIEKIRAEVQKQYEEWQAKQPK